MPRQVFVQAFEQARKARLFKILDMIDGGDLAASREIVAVCADGS